MAANQPNDQVPHLMGPKSEGYSPDSDTGSRGEDGVGVENLSYVSLSAGTPLVNFLGTLNRPSRSSSSSPTKKETGGFGMGLMDDILSGLRPSRSEALASEDVVIDSELSSFLAATYLSSSSLSSSDLANSAQTAESSTVSPPLPQNASSSYQNRYIPQVSSSVEGERGVTSKGIYHENFRIRATRMFQRYKTLIVSL
jgi:hypothetical protein